MAMATGPKGLDLIRAKEGYHTKLKDGGCKAYLDKLPGKQYWTPGYNGLWTIGYGCTEGVTEGLVWTRQQAEAELLKRIKPHEAALNAKIKLVGVTLNQNQYDGLISASWNLGHESTLIIRVLQAIKHGASAAEINGIFKQYNHAGGKVVRGLTIRRTEEASLFNAVPEVAVALADVPSSSPVLAPSIDEMITAGELASQSRKVSLLVKVRNWLGFGATAGTVVSLADVDDGASHVHNIMTTFKGDAWLLVIGMCVAGVVVAAVLIAWIIQDRQQGRYQPSKGA